MGEDGRVLVPDLQDVQEPELSDFGERPLRFYFEYSFLPSSVLPRFTVRMHEEIVDDLRWRTGLVVSNEDYNATAIVKSDPDGKRVEIEVYGEYKREYFSCIRREFFRIHGGFRKLKVTQWIPLDDDGSAVTYENLYGHWKAGKEEYFDGETGRSYSVNRLLDGIESGEELLANFLRSRGIGAKELQGKTGQDIKIYVQNNIGEYSKGLQAGGSSGVGELFSADKRGEDGRGEKGYGPEGG